MSVPFSFEPPISINALTVTKTKHLSGKDPRVIDKRREEFQTLMDWGFAKTEGSTEGKTIVRVILIPPEADGKVKVRVGIRGDQIRDPVESSAYLPSSLARMAFTLDLIGKECEPSDVRKAYYNTPYNGDVLMRIPQYLK